MALGTWADALGVLAQVGIDEHAAIVDLTVSAGSGSVRLNCELVPKPPPNADGTFYVVGLNGDAPAWSLEGVYRQEADAVAECTTTRHWVGPGTLDAGFPDDVEGWPGLYFPLKKLDAET